MHVLKAPFDIALHDICAQALPECLYINGWGGVMIKIIHTDMTVGLDAPHTHGRSCPGLCKQSGFDKIKIKLGTDVADRHVERVALIRKAVGPEVVLCVDANQGWSVVDAIAALQQMASLSNCLLRGAHFKSYYGHSFQR